MSIPSQLYVYIVSEEEHDDQAVIIEEGGYSNWAYIVLEGQVKVKKNTDKGLATIHTVKEGGIFGRDKPAEMHFRPTHDVRGCRRPGCRRFARFK